MTRHVRLRELLVGVEGLALLRHLYDGTDEAASQRLAEVRRLLDDDAFAGGELTSEADPKTAYRSWAETYDEPGNPIIALEEPVVWGLLESVPPGRARRASSRAISGGSRRTTITSTWSYAGWRSRTCRNSTARSASSHGC